MYHEGCRVAGQDPDYVLPCSVGEIPPTVVASGTSTPFSRKPTISPMVDYVKTKERKGGREREREKAERERFPKARRSSEIRPDFGRSFRRESSPIRPPRERESLPEIAGAVFPSQRGDPDIGRRHEKHAVSRRILTVRRTCPHVAARKPARHCVRFSEAKCAVARVCILHSRCSSALIKYIPPRRRFVHVILRPTECPPPLIVRGVPIVAGP